MEDAPVGDRQRLITRDSVSTGVAVIATGAALGLGVTQQIITSVTNWEFPSWRETALQVARDVGLLAITAGGFRIAHRRRPAADDVGIPHCRTCRLRVMAASAAAVALTGVAVALIDSEMSIPLVLATVVIRWPISVVAQQVFFFGWLQPRLGSRGLSTAALLYAAYHLYSPAAAVLVLPLGFAFAYLRRRSGTIVPGIALHWLAQIGYQSFS